MSKGIEPVPDPADFALLKMEEEIDELIMKLTQLGISYAEAEANIEKRKKCPSNKQ